MQRGLYGAEQHRAGICHIGARSGVWQVLFEPAAAVFTISGRQRLFFPLARAVDDAILGHSKQPCAGLLKGIGGGVELEQHVLQDVFSLSRITHSSADESAQPRVLTRDDFVETPGVGGHSQVGWRVQAGWGIHDG